jgi:excisionase family DNA binding protein
MNILTVPAAAQEFDIPEQTLYSAVREGRIEAQKVGGTWIIERGAIERYLETYQARAERPKEATMEIATHKSGEGTVVMKEGDTGYIVTVNKEAMPPHYSKEHATYQEAAAGFERLTKETMMILSKDDICVEINAGSWAEVQRAFSDLSVDEIAAKLDEMFPHDENRQIAQEIYDKLQ